VKVRTMKEIDGIYPDLQPKVGKIYEAKYYPGTKTSAPFVAIAINGKKVILRKGEYEEVKGDSKMKRPVEEAIEDKEIEISQTETKAAEIAEKIMQRNENEAYRKEYETAKTKQHDEDLLQLLAEAQSRIFRLERAILAMTVEMYG